MTSTSPEVAKTLVERIDVRLKLWNKLWVAFLGTYFLLGTGSVALSALAATDILADEPRKICSVIAAVCVALLGFLRPEVRYRNLVRAWRELDVEKTRYIQTQVTGGVDPAAERLLQVLARTERVASDDEPDSSRAAGDRPLMDELQSTSQTARDTEALTPKQP